MTDLSNWVLTTVVSYGAPGFGLILLVAALGVPLPSTMLVLAAGAFVSQGTLDIWQAVGLGLVGSVLGDSGSYLLGRFGGNVVLKRFTQMATWQKAQLTFDQRGFLAVLLTRFLLTPLALPVNLIAGSSKYLFIRFALGSILGQSVWLGVFGGLGYLFAGSWEALSDGISNMAGALVGVVAVGGGMWMLWRKRHPAPVVIASETA